MLTNFHAFVYPGQIDSGTRSVNIALHVALYLICSDHVRSVLRCTVSL